MNRNLVKAIADIAIFIEFTDENLLNSDAALEAMEQLAMELQLMTDEDRNRLSMQLKKISLEYAEEHKALFVENLPEFLGLE